MTESLEVMRKGLAVARRIGEADAFAAWRKQEVVPGSGTSGESVDAFIRKATGPTSTAPAPAAWEPTPNPSSTLPPFVSMGWQDCGSPMPR